MDHIKRAVDLLNSKLDRDMKAAINPLIKNILEQEKKDLNEQFKKYQELLPPKK